MAEDRLGTGFEVYLENTAGGGVFTKIGDVLGGTPGSISRDEVQVTDSEDTQRQFIAGLTDNGVLTFRIAYDGGDTVQEALQNEVKAGPTADGKDIAFYHSGMDEHWHYVGFLTGFSVSEYSPGAHMTATLTFRVNSATGPTAGAPSTS